MTHVSVNSDRGEIAFYEKVVEGFASENIFYENDNLVELEHVEDLIKFFVLFSLLKLKVVLLEPF